MILKFVWNQKRLKIAKSIFSKKSKAVDLAIPDFKFFHIAKAVKTVKYWHKNNMQINIS